MNLIKRQLQDFKALDQNGDGKVTEEEYVNVATEAAK